MRLTFSRVIELLSKPSSKIRGVITSTCNLIPTPFRTNIEKQFESNGMLYQVSFSYLIQWCFFPVWEGMLMTVIKLGCILSACIWYYLFLSLKWRWLNVSSTVIFRKTDRQSVYWFSRNLGWSRYTTAVFYLFCEEQHIQEVSNINSGCWKGLWNWTSIWIKSTT